MLYACVTYVEEYGIYIIEYNDKRHEIKILR